MTRRQRIQRNRIIIAVLVGVVLGQPVLGIVVGLVWATITPLEG